MNREILKNCPEVILTQVHHATIHKVSVELHTIRSQVLVALLSHGDALFGRHLGEIKAKTKRVTKNFKHTKSYQVMAF